MSLTIQLSPTLGTVINVVPVDYIDRLLLDDQGRLRAAFPAETFTAINPVALKLWCHYRARYALPTLELITWLRARIGGREAIEVAAGNGDVGYLAGIRETDSYIQQTPALRLQFKLMAQVSTNPPPSVRKLDALAAIKKYRPRVVVAAWFTRKFEIGKDQEGISQASIYGAREEEIIAQVDTYIHIGNENIHGQKTALQLPHETIKFPGLLSRMADHESNVIHVWDRKS